MSSTDTLLDSRRGRAGLVEDWLSRLGKVYDVDGVELDAFYDPETRTWRFSVEHFAAADLMQPRPGEPEREGVLPGNISSTLARVGWGAVIQCLKQSEVCASVEMVGSETEFNAPLRDDIRSEVEVSECDLDRALQRLEHKNCGGLSVQSRLLSKGSICASMTARYCLIRQ